MLDHLGRRDAARRVRDAVRTAIRRGETTADIGGTLGTEEVGDRIARELSP